jgi:hypothetical protein
MSLVITVFCGLVVLQGWSASLTPAAEPNMAAEPAVEPSAETEPAPEATEPNGPPPKIVFEQPVHDFGLVAPDSVQDCVFNFKNEGPGVLKIKDISKTCGCTVFELEKREYAPGEKGVLKVQYHADRGAGARSRHLYVFSNDPVNEKVELTIKATVAQKIVFEPDRLEYKLKGEGAGQAKLTIRSLDGQQFTITKFDATSGAVIADFDSAQKDANFVFMTKIDPSKMGASTVGRIEIGLTHPETSSIIVPFSVLSRFRVDPPAINVLNAVPGEKMQRELWLLDNYDEDFEIDSAASAQGIIKVISIEKLGNRYKIIIEIMPPEKQNNARMFNDTLTLTTKDGEKINVTCRGFYKR